MVSWDFSLGTTLRALRYYLSGLKVLPNQLKEEKIIPNLKNCLGQPFDFCYIHCVLPLHSMLGMPLLVWDRPM